MAFPPVPVYPKGLDSDYTLFLVHNTTETRLCADNPAWSDQIDIMPVPLGQAEIWPTNGFGNISGEMFYYDAVDKDVDGRVIRLKNCARSLAGNKTTFNPRGTWVRSFVVAEHHNQLAQAILNVENFIGYNFDPRHETLDWRIRNLQALTVIFDDFSCPDINFSFAIVENDPSTGVLANYAIEINPPGSFNEFRLDFGDGQFTVTDLVGQHRYALNAIIDPVITVSNDQCQIIQTPIERTNPSEPVATTTQAFDFPIPEIPAIPDFNFVPCQVSEPDFILPPLVPPCDLSLSTGTSTVITGPNLSMVSNVLIEGPSNPVQILYSHVTITGPDIPSIIFVDAPPTIVIDPPIPPTIVVVAQSSITMGLDLTDVPKIPIDWGSGPQNLNVQMTMATKVAKPMQRTLSGDPEIAAKFGSEFADLFHTTDQIKVEYDTASLPSEIHIIVPEKFPELKIDSSDLKPIKLDTTDANLPEYIPIYGPETPLPTDIHIHGPKKPLPDRIEVVNKNLPNQLDVVYSGPLSIDLNLKGQIPEKVVIEQTRPLPEKIVLDVDNFPKSVSVTGFPEAIPITGFPDGIRLLPPETMPPMEVVYRGDPIEVKITMDKMIVSDEEGKTNCVMIVPCNR